MIFAQKINDSMIINGYFLQSINHDRKTIDELMFRIVDTDTSVIPIVQVAGAILANGHSIYEADLSRAVPRRAESCRKTSLRVEYYYWRAIMRPEDTSLIKMKEAWQFKNRLGC